MYIYHVQVGQYSDSIPNEIKCYILALSCKKKANEKQSNDGDNDVDSTVCAMKGLDVMCKVVWLKDDGLFGCGVFSILLILVTEISGNDHTNMTAPLPVCSAKLSMFGPG